MTVNSDTVLIPYITNLLLRSLPLRRNQKSGSKQKTKPTFLRRSIRLTSRNKLGSKYQLLQGNRILRCSQRTKKPQVINPVRLAFSDKELRHIASILNAVTSTMNFP